MKRIGMLLVLSVICVAGVRLAYAAQPFERVKMAGAQNIAILESFDKGDLPANLASSLDRLYALYKTQRDFRSYAEDNRVQLKGDMVVATMLPYQNRSTADIDDRLLQKLGVTIKAKGKHSMRVEIPIAELRRVANAVQGIAEIHNVIRPIPDAIISEGVALMNANTWQSAGYTGTGAKVAVIDGGFAELTEAQANGDIPSSYYSLDLTGRGLEAYADGEHGTAVTEAVYDVAPGAALYLYKIDDLTDLEAAKNDAISQGVHVINHSMSWFGLSYYDGTGGACNVAADAIANGITWVNSAGNHAEDHYRAVFVPTLDNFHDFTGTGEKLNPMGPDPGYVWLFPAGVIIQVWLNWNNYPTTSEDYDLYLYKWNPSNSTWEAIASSTNRQSNSSPTESIAYLNRTSNARYAVAVKKYSATTNVDFTIFASYGLSYHMVENSITDPGSHSDVVTVGAIGASYYSTGPQEYFSGQGPTTDGRPKPDVAAPDSCDSFAYGYWQGTSLSSPHTAGVCALIRSRFPSFSESEIRNYLYTKCTFDLGDPGRDNVYGWGKVLLPNFGEITVTSPNGGEDWAVGSTHAITWTSSGTSGTVKINYSVDNGNSWIPITAICPDTGAFRWTIPNTPSSQCLVQVADTAITPVDKSDAVFAITLLSIADLRASVQGSSILLEWSPVNGAESYNVYRGTSYDFVPDKIGGSNRIGTQIVDEDPGTNGIQWTDTGNGATVVGDVNVYYCYRVTAVVPSQSFETDPSNLALEFDYPLITTGRTDINEIAVLVNTQNTRKPISTAEELAQAIPNCTDVYYWDAAGQGIVGHPKGLPFSNFSIIPGYPYIVNVVADTVWTVAGSYEMPQFNLITTSGTDINNLTVPLEKAGLTTAEALGTDISNCTDVYYWDAASQGIVGHVVGLPFANFSVQAGYPYYVNVTAPTTWPASGTMLSTAPTGLLRSGSMAPNKARGTAGAPHIAFGKINSSSSQCLPKDGFKIKAWIAGRSEEILTQDDIGTGCDGSYWWVAVSNFPSKWAVGDTLHVIVSHDKIGLNAQASVKLTNAGSDYAGEAQTIEAATGISDQKGNTSPKLILQSSHPNPFNAETEITFRLTSTGQVKVQLYDVTGRLVRTIFSGVKESGEHRVLWNGRDDAAQPVSSGIYFCVIEAFGVREMIKLGLIK
ncbi:MAG: S8 family serine peptidase [candidate division KSB1 bacterium]|nr:S8 family serine peptidase [candidate division KSB1 bacterium]MDZ7358107.1 S8 family serine peptidase [candidate division KSB1 bacterium]MDZ7375904.1 S8 family serine peptidase [candidate division KSB1 bacterium]